MVNYAQIFREILPVLQKFAPTLAAIVGGPAGIATGFVIPLLANAFKLDFKPGSLSGLVSSILSASDAPEKLNAIEKEHAPWLSAMMDETGKLAKAEISVKLEWQPISNNSQGPAQ